MKLRRVPLVIISILLISFGLSAVYLLRPFETWMQLSLLPLARVFNNFGFGVGQVLRPAPDSKQLIADVRELEARLASISVDYVKLRSLEEENLSLRKLAGFLESSGYDHVGAQVIARSSDPRSATVLIDRGAADGLENGMAVIMEDGIFIGKITLLREHVSTVTLVSDKRSRIAVARAGSKALAGVLQGEGNGVASLRLIPQNAALQRDVLLVTASLEDKIPPNLPIAVVNQVEGRPTDPFKSASLQPLARLDQIHLVVVLRPIVLRPQ